MKRILHCVLCSARRAGTAVQLVTAMFLLTAVSGCFKTQHEVFGPNEGVPISGLEGEYASSSDEPGYIVISRVAGGDYRYSQSARIVPNDHEKREVVNKAQFRAIPLAGTLYIMQSCEHESPVVGYYRMICTYAYVRVVYSGKAVARIELLEEEADIGDLQQIARGDGIDLWGLGVGGGLYGLSGFRTDLARYLGGVPDVATEFRPIMTYRKITEGSAKP